MSIMGVDIGSSGVKAIVFSLNGDVLSSAYCEYPHYFENPGWLEIEPEEVWDSIMYCISECNTLCKHDPVNAISVSALGEAITPIDINGNYLNKTILSADNRAQDESDSICKEFDGLMNIKSKTGAICHPKHPASKLLWFYNHRPEIFKKTWKFLGWLELFSYKMGFTPAIDESNAGKTMMYNIETRTWDNDMLSATRVRQDKLPNILPSGSILGIIPEKIAKELGFTVPVTLVMGSFDQTCVALGAGAIAPNMASLGLGTVAALTVIFDESAPDSFNSNNDIYPIIPHVYPCRYVTCATVMTGGQLLKWFRDQFSRWEIEEAKKANIDPYDLILSDLPKNPGDILILPHFVGAGAPWNDPFARGCIFGLTARHTRKDFIKAILESIAYETKHNMVTIEKLGIPIKSIFLSGGGTRSRTWMQIIADIIGIEVIPIMSEQVGCCGAAIIAGKGTGQFMSYEEGISRFVKRDAPILPNQKKHRIYKERFQIYKDLYLVSKEINHRITFSTELTE